MSSVVMTAGTFSLRKPAKRSKVSVPDTSTSSGIRHALVLAHMLMPDLTPTNRKTETEARSMNGRATKYDFTRALARTRLAAANISAIASDAAMSIVSVRMAETTTKDITPTSFARESIAENHDGF